VSRYQKGKTNLDFTEARDSEWRWHQLGHMQVCTLLQTDNHATPHNSVFTGRMPFLPPNQQLQSTEGMKKNCIWNEMLCSENLILCRLAKCCDASIFALAAKFHIEPYNIVRSSVAHIKDSFCLV